MIAYSEISAFTDIPGQGNQAGVVLDAVQMSEEQMQALASFLDVPETVFVTRRAAARASQPGLVQVRYFTPTQEVDFCGHATIALGLSLAQAGLWRGEALELETLAGRVPLRLECVAGVPERIWMQQPELSWRTVARSWHQPLAEALGLSDRMLHKGLPLACAHTGLWSVFVPLLDSFLLGSLEPDMAAIRHICEELQVGSLYVYAPLGVGRYAARDFAPCLGIPEDPVTGSAAGALFGLLATQQCLPVRVDKVIGQIVQGHALGRSGQVEVELQMQGERVLAVHVGGQAALNREGYWQGE